MNKNTTTNCCTLASKHDPLGASCYVVVVVSWYFLIIVALYGAGQIKRKTITGREFRSHLLLNKMKIRIPHDMALVGFTNSNLSEVLNPPLTCVYQPAFLIGQMAAQKLMNLIVNKKRVTEFETTVLPTQFFARNSSLNPSVT